MKSLHLQKSSHLIDHSLSHFSPVLVREDQEHFNRSILPGAFLFDERSNSNGQQFSQLRKFTKFKFTKFFANPKNPRSKPSKWQGFWKTIAGVYRLVIKVQKTPLVHLGLLGWHMAPAGLKVVPLEGPAKFASKDLCLPKKKSWDEALKRCEKNTKIVENLGKIWTKQK